MKNILKGFFLLALTTLSLQAWAFSFTNCSSADINLADQKSVDEFQTDFGPCDAVTGNLTINNTDVVNLDGLSALVSVGGSLNIMNNPALTSLDGLSSLTFIEGYLRIWSNRSLPNVDGLSSLETVKNHLSIDSNLALTNLDGLANFSRTEHLTVIRNAALDSCYGLAMLLDDVDDAEAGPGPGIAGIPDVGDEVTMDDNLKGCNSVAEALVNPFVAPIPSLSPFALVLLTLLMMFGGFMVVRRKA